MRKNILLWSLAGVLVVVIAAGVTVRWQFYGNAVTEERDLYVSGRAEYAQMVDSLLPRIRHHRAFGAYARRIDLERTFKPGHYVLRPGMSVIEVARMLKLGTQTPVRVTINNVRIPAQLAQKLARQIDAGFLTEAEGIKIFTQIIAAQHLGDVHKAGIGRILQALHIGLLTMTAGFPRL